MYGFDSFGIEKDGKVYADKRGGYVAITISTYCESKKSFDETIEDWIVDDMENFKRKEDSNCLDVFSSLEEYGKTAEGDYVWISSPDGVKAWSKEKQAFEEYTYEYVFPKRVEKAS
jgi:hypothetical protein